MTNGRNSLRTRLLAVAKELKKRKDKGKASRRSHTRWSSTTDLGVVSRTILLDEIQKASFQQTVGSSSTKWNERTISKKNSPRSEPFSNEEQALEFLHQQWGEDLDPSLVNIMLQRIVLQPEFEAIGVEDAVNSVQNSMKNLVQHYDE